MCDSKGQRVRCIIFRSSAAGNMLLVHDTRLWLIVQVCSAMIRQYGSCVAQPSHQIPDAELAVHLMRPLAALSRCHITHDAAGAASGAVAAPDGTVTALQQAQKQWQAALQTALALVLRNLTPAAPSLAAFARSSPADLPCSLWQRFADVCVTACTSALRASKSTNGPAAVGVLASAAARCVCLLATVSDAPARASNGASPAHEGASSYSASTAAHLRRGTSLYEAIAAAMQLHAAAVQASTDAAQRDDADTSSAASVEQLYPLADAHKGAEIKASGKVLTNLLTAVCAGIGNEHGAAVGDACAKWREHILTTPWFLPCMPAVHAVLLQAPGTSAMLTAMLVTLGLACSGPAAARSRLAALCSVVQLGCAACGPSQQSSGHRQHDGRARVAVAPASAHDARLLAEGLFCGRQ